jgi:hypothetical protein
LNEQQRADHYLASLHYWLDHLRWFEAASGSATLSELDERECEAFPFEWDNIVDRIAAVERAASGEVLGSKALTELRGVAEELTDLLPIMERLRLRQPDGAALPRAAGRPATAQTT